jgi:hypothetical protein
MPRLPLSRNMADYLAFEQVLVEARERTRFHDERGARFRVPRWIDQTT